MENLECRLSSIPEFIHEKKFLIVRIKVGEVLVVDGFNVELNYELLAQLSESMKGKLILEISNAESSLFQKDFNCEAFAPDQ